MIAVDEIAIAVNGVAITSEQVDCECLNYPSETFLIGRQMATRTLVVRELLLQEAVRQGLCDRDGVLNQPDRVVERLLAAQIKVSAPSVADCRQYFENNRENFSTAPLFEASHVFFPVPPGELVAREDVRRKVVGVLGKIKANPDDFDEIARVESSCSSAVKGGCLGALTKGQVVPSFEAALMLMQKGEISEQPVETAMGFHIIRVDDRIDGEEMPFDIVKSWISQYLTEQRWNNVVDQYVGRLAGQARVDGFDVVVLQS